MREFSRKPFVWERGGVIANKYVDRMETTVYYIDISILIIEGF